MLRYINAMSIKSKVMLAFVVLILLPFSVLGLYTYDQSQRFLRAQLIANASTTLKQITFTIENKIDLLESLSDSITYNYRLQQFLGSPFSGDDSLDTYFSYAAPLINYAMLFQKVNTEKISVYMKNDSIPEGFGAFFRATRAMQEPWYAPFAESGAKSAWIVRDSPEAGRTYGYVQKMVSLEGADIGFTLVEVRPGDLLGTALQENPEADQDVVIADAQGELVFPAGSAVGPPLPLQRKLADGGHAVLGGRLYIGERLDRVGLSMLMNVRLPRTANSWQVASNLIFIAATVVLLFAFYSVLQMALRTMRTSIRQMDQAIESGFEPIPIRRRDEFGVISERFNLLLNKITTLMKDMIRKETIQKDAQLAALQSQINPHFIYNTLDMFSARMELAGQFEVSDAMADFGKMMRYNMDGRSKFATLESEIRYLEQYMNLQKIKYGGDIELDIQVPVELLALRMIRFILQPIVENSIKHGFPANGSLRIVLTAGLQPERTVLISIKDNGPGIDETRLASLNRRFRDSDYAPPDDQTRESIGLGNINERLKLFYGEIYAIRLNSLEGEYAETIVTIPCGNGEEDNHV
ncbi:cache domain-containing sensor histidine kinase [Cohnella hashimotonis]|uniref:Histidine kinase n=1 Tax=Cohnella hashimotonis TaxID=2826895 RepID=A0ABT6TNL7_9BACL|nr:sensor histidine kinase [Cohnella hashimotonis]MDI4648452.1 histidine kinase [Cohnella hashimotonis]